MIPNVVDLSPNAKLVIGIIPCLNHYFHAIAWDLVADEIETMANQSMGDFSAWKINNGIYYGGMNLFLMYIDPTGEATEEKFQEIFVDKLKTPRDNYAGFFITQLLETSYHVYLGFIKEEYRTGEVLRQGLSYIEKTARKARAPYLSLSAVADEAYRKFGYTKLTTNFRKKL